VQRAVVLATLLVACGNARSVERPTAVTSATPVTVSASVSSAPKQPKVTVHIVPLGDVPLADLEVAAKGIRDQAPFGIVIAPRADLPKHTETAEKGRYSADALLYFLKTIKTNTNDKVLGVLALDIVTPKNNVPNWGVLGLGDIDGKACVLSTYRMRRKWEPGGGAAEPLVRERLWKIAVHELGHTLGLPHCPNKGCLMQDAHGTVKTVDDEGALCADCRARFVSALE
jgi:archaemetzincin